MDILELIAEVLCRMDLPDRDVYPALARHRDERGGESEENLLQAFEDCVRRGLDLPGDADFWARLAEHSAFGHADACSEALLEKSKGESTRLYRLLKEAAQRLNLTGGQLTALLRELQRASEDHVRRVLVPVFVESARQRLKIAADDSVWSALAKRPEMRGDSDMEDLCRVSKLLENIETVVADNRTSQLEALRSIAFQIQWLLGDNPRPPRRRGDGGPGVTFPRPPRKPKPSEPERKRPPG